jgi:signal transduction histidine kinase
MFWAETPIVEGGPENLQTRLVRRALLAELGDDAENRLVLSYSQQPDFRRLPGFRRDGEDRRGRRRSPPNSRDLDDEQGLAPEILLGAFRLADNSWLNFAAPLAAFRPFWMTQFFAIILGTTLVVLAISVWAIRRATQPLSMFARAAERLGLDMNAPALAEEGPKEVRGASHAFNQMQRRLQNFVRDRTQMLAAISHDLRTPITRLRLRAELIEDPEQQKKILKDLDDIETMVSATLEFARDDFAQERRTAIDLAVLLQNVCDEAEDAGATISYDGPSHLPFAGRPVALKRAFANLVGNAVKYGDGAAVELKAHPRLLRVSVADHGPGIPQEELQRVFEPFYRVEASRNRDTGGVGLGLAVVRSVVRAHGGDVELANRSEGGLGATVTLPLMDA